MGVMGLIAGLIKPQPVTIASPTQQPSRELIDFLKAWEGCRLTPYQDQGGKWTVGVGHLMAATEQILPITQDRCDQLLLGDLSYTADRVRALTYGLLTQARFDGLCSFAFNLGSKALADSTLLKYVNAGRYNDAAGEFWKWRNVRAPSGALVPDRGLEKRRNAERDIFMFGDYSGRP